MIYICSVLQFPISIFHLCRYVVTYSSYLFFKDGTDHIKIDTNGIKKYLKNIQHLSACSSHLLQISLKAARGSSLFVIRPYKEEKDKRRHSDGRKGQTLHLWLTSKPLLPGKRSLENWSFVPFSVVGDRLIDDLRSTATEVKPYMIPLSLF